MSRVSVWWSFKGGITLDEDCFYYEKQVDGTVMPLRGCLIAGIVLKALPSLCMTNNVVHDSPG